MIHASLCYAIKDDRLQAYLTGAATAEQVHHHTCSRTNTHRRSEENMPTLKASSPNKKPTSWRPTIPSRYDSLVHLAPFVTRCSQHSSSFTSSRTFKDSSAIPNRQPGTPSFWIDHSVLVSWTQQHGHPCSLLLTTHNLYQQPTALQYFCCETHACCTCAGNFVRMCNLK